MPEIIEIENGMASVITKNVTRRIPLSELLKRVERVPVITLPTIANSQVFANWSQTNGETTMQVLCELQPAIRSITKNNRRTAPRGLRRYRLAFPWTYFWFTARSGDSPDAASMRFAIHSTRVFFARDKYKDVNSPMIVAALPNLDSTGEVCWGSTATPANQSLAGQLDQKVNEWYLSDFNDDLDSHIFLPYGERNMKRWVDESREDANSWRNWPEFSDLARRITVAQLVRDSGIVFTEAERFTGGEFIPGVELPMTYGAWEEWLRNKIPANQVARLQRAIENVRTDTPDEYVDEEEIENTGEVDDGGVPA